jgi:hypothetical protein
MPGALYGLRFGNPIADLHTISQMASEAERRRVLAVQAQQAEEQQKALQAAPTDLTTLRPYTQEKVEYFGPVTGEPIHPEQVQGWNITPQEAEKRGILRIQRTPGALTLPELAQRVQKDPAALAAFNQQLRGNRGNLVVDLGLKPTLGAQEEARQREGMNLISQQFDSPPKNKEESAAWIGKIAKIAANYQLKPFMDTTFDILLKTYAEAPDQFGGIVAHFNAQMAEQRKTMGEKFNYDEAKANALAATAQAFRGVKSLQDALGKAVEWSKPSTRYEGVGGGLVETTPGQQPRVVIQPAPEVRAPGEQGLVAIDRPLIVEGKPPAPLTQAAPPSPTTGSLLAPGQPGFGVAPLAVPSETPPPLAQPAGATGVQGVRTLIPAPTEEQRLKRIQGEATARKLGANAAQTPGDKARDELAQLRLQNMKTLENAGNVIQMIEAGQNPPAKEVRLHLAALRPLYVQHRKDAQDIVGMDEEGRAFAREQAKEVQKTISILERYLSGKGREAPGRSAPGTGDKQQAIKDFIGGQ